MAADRCRRAGPGRGARVDPDRVEALWGHLADMGVLGLLVPEADGGMGFDEVAAAVVLAECGYVAVPLPVVEAMCVVAPTHRRSCTAARRGRLGRRGRRGRPGGRGDGPLRLRRVVADELAFERAALGTAAVLIGLGRRMLDLTVAYVAERHQFGVPVGSFQAVKHHLADARLQLEFAAPAVWRAAWSLANGADTAPRDVSMAKVMAADASHLVGRKALQCHGGIGYTVEYDLHLYLKRAWALEKIWGDSAFHRARVAQSIGVA